MPDPVIAVIFGCDETLCPETTMSSFRDSPMR